MTCLPVLTRLLANPLVHSLKSTVILSRSVRAWIFWFDSSSRASGQYAIVCSSMTETARSRSYQKLSTRPVKGLICSVPSSLSWGLAWSWISSRPRVFAAKVWASGSER